MMILATFSSCCCYEFWLPFPPAAAEAFAAAAAEAGPRMGKHHVAPKSEAFAAAAAAGPRMGKQHGSEGQRSFKIAPRKCLT